MEEFPNRERPGDVLTPPSMSHWQCSPPGWDSSLLSHFTSYASWLLRMMPFPFMFQVVLLMVSAVATQQSGWEHRDLVLDFNLNLLPSLNVDDLWSFIRIPGLLSSPTELIQSLSSTQLSRQLYQFVDHLLHMLHLDWGRSPSSLQNRLEIGYPL